MPILAVLALSLAQADEWHFSDVDRIVAVGDVHGAYGALVTTLRHAEILGEDLSWIGGETHLVLTGDLLDRGAESRRVMDLIMRLEKEAKRGGGRVHQLLGNHEVMNIIGDLRYVADGEFAAFVDVESADERQFWYRRFRDNWPADADESSVRAAFDEAAPPGYFGHRRAFRTNGKYGRWLLKKPFIVVVNDTAFVHGGLPSLIHRHGLSGANVGLKSDLLEYARASADLMDAGVLNAVDQFKQIPGILTEKLEAGQLKGTAAQVASWAIELKNSPLHGPAGPTWYRGTASCSALVEGDYLAAALQTIGAERVAMGHTSTITRTVQQRMGGRVLEIDTGMLHETYGGSGNALVIEGDDLFVINEDGRRDLAPTQHPVRVGHESLPLTDSELAAILENGEIRSPADSSTTWQLIPVKQDGVSVVAYFRPLSSGGGFAPELAAYTLDRMLGLGMVPVTVRREIDGIQGVLQFVPASSLTERGRVAAGEGWGSPCPLHKQFAAMFVFDALIGNVGRTPSSMLYDPEDWLLVLVDHAGSFGTTDEWPTYVQETGLVVGDEWRKALLELHDVRLEGELGAYLDDERLAALGRRRDALLQLSMSR